MKDLESRGANRQTIHEVINADNPEGARRYFDAARQLAGKDGDPNILLKRIKAGDPTVTGLANEVIAGWSRNFEREAEEAQGRLAAQEDQKARKLALAARELVARTNELTAKTTRVQLDPSAFTKANFHSQNGGAPDEKNPEIEESFEDATLRISPNNGVIDKDPNG